MAGAATGTDQPACICGIKLPCPSKEESTSRLLWEGSLVLASENMHSSCVRKPYLAPTRTVPVTVQHSLLCPKEQKTLAESRENSFSVLRNSVVEWFGLEVTSKGHLVPTLFLSWSPSTRPGLHKVQSKSTSNVSRDGASAAALL